VVGSPRRLRLELGLGVDCKTVSQEEADIFCFCFCCLGFTMLCFVYVRCQPDIQRPPTERLQFGTVIMLAK
jgi:hypothetical protein